MTCKQPRSVSAQCNLIRRTYVTVDGEVKEYENVRALLPVPAKFLQHLHITQGSRWSVRLGDDGMTLIYVREDV